MPELKDVIMYGTHNARPQGGIIGRLFFEGENGKLFRDNGFDWDLVAINSNPTIPQTFDWNFVIGNGTDTINTGIAGGVEVPVNCSITSVKLVALTSGSAQLDIQKCTYANINPGTHPVSGDSIIGTGAKPTLSSSYKSITDLSGWTTLDLSTGDWIFINVVSCSLPLLTLSVIGVVN